MYRFAICCKQARAERGTEEHDPAAPYGPPNRDDVAMDGCNGIHIRVPDGDKLAEVGHHCVQGPSVMNVGSCETRSRLRYARSVDFEIEDIGHHIFLNFDFPR